MAAAEPRRRRLLLAALGAVLATTGCSASGGVAPKPADEPLRYAALGDSFTAAPFVPRTDVAEGCLRSSGNYPSIVAEELDARLVDVSCSGADTADVEGFQTVGFGGSRVAPQLRAVGPDTDLVTVSIGGNDEGLFAALGRECTPAGGAAPGACASALTAALGGVEPVIDRTRERVAAVLDRVRERAPQATVVLVGYTRLVARDRDCPALPLSDADRAVLVGVEERLNRAFARAARAAGVRFLDMHPASEGHEVCGEEPWVNGLRHDQRRAMALHPFAEGQQAVADRLLALLDEELDG